MVMRLISKLLIFSLVISLCGCTKEKEALSLGEWIHRLNTELHLPKASAIKPYYVHIPEKHRYYEDVQAAVEWGIIESSVPLQVDEPLTREWLAYTLMNCINNNVDAKSIKDNQKTQFPKQCSQAVAFGLLEVDKRGLFLPKKVVSDEEAMEKLALISGYIQHFTITDSKFLMEYNDDIKVIDEKPLVVDKENKTIRYGSDQALKENDLIKVRDDNTIYRVNHVEKEMDDFIYTIDEAEFTSIINDCDIEHSFTVDFNDVVIEEDEVFSDTSFLFTSVKAIEKEIKGFKITVSMSGNSINAKVAKGNITASLNVYDVTPTMKWVMKEGMIEHGLFKVNFKSNQTANYKASHQITHEFNEMEYFIPTLLNKVKTIENVELVIPICTFKIPISQIPGMSVRLGLQCSMQANGTIECTLVQQAGFGVEIRNNKARYFHHIDNDASCSIKADSGLLVGVKSALWYGIQPLVDGVVEAGFKAIMDSHVHLYDKEGNVSSYKIKAPSDIASEAAEQVNDVLVCSDSTGYYIARITFNSATTLASKLGLSKTVELMSVNDVMKGITGHYENGHRVAQCTRKNKVRLPSIEPLIKQEMIVVAKNNMVLNKGEKDLISIVSLPTDSKVSDLRFSSSDNSIAKVDGNGAVSAISSGNAIITIDDGKHQCNVVVHVKLSNE